MRMGAILDSCYGNSTWTKFMSALDCGTVRVGSAHAPGFHSNHSVRLSSSELKSQFFILLIVTMDETVRPLRIPPQTFIYADKHNIFQLLQSLLSSLLIDRPDEPIDYLIRWLQRDLVGAPRVVLLGPPAVGKRTLARKLSAELGAAHVTPESLLENQSEQSIQELPVELLVKRIQERLSASDVTQVRAPGCSRPAPA